MNVIYEPKGKAREYSALACNIFTGCRHGCKYCYCPNIMRRPLGEWSKNPAPRKDILKKLEIDAIKLRGDSREILFCFMCDPYQSDVSAWYMSQALEICEKYNLNPQVLTKNGHLAEKDFETLKRNNWKFGSTIIFLDEALRDEWEPSAPSVKSRINALKKAKEMGIFTWVSVEPVVNAEQALATMRELKPYVDFWKVGKLNHFPEVEKKIDWKKFLKNTREVLKDSNYYIKRDLKKLEG